MLFKEFPLLFADSCREVPSSLKKTRRIKAVYYESAGIGKGREQEDGIADIQYHLFTSICAFYKAAFGEYEIVVDGARASKHEPDAKGRYQIPRVWTASKIEGRLIWDEGEVELDLRQAKGAPKNEKYIWLFDKDNHMPTEIDLNESGWRAHARMLEELLKPAPDMRHDPADAIKVMELIDVARSISIEEPTYEFGYQPKFFI
jgi:hypothetical protein